MDKLSYLAGIIDGEACCYWCKNGKNNIRIFIIEVKMTSEPVIDWLLENFGGDKCLLKKYKPTHKNQFRWRIKGKKGIALYSSIKHMFLVRDPKKDLLRIGREPGKVGRKIKT